VIFSSFKWNESTVLELDHAVSAYIQYRFKRLNLITGFPEAIPLENFISELDRLKLEDRVELPAVFHFHYELGLVLAGMGHTVSDETPLAIFIQYKNAKKRRPRKSRLKSIPLKSLERPTWSEYKGAFQHIQNELLDGNCYQVNLTYPFDFETEENLDPRDIRDFFMSRKNIGAYAHTTYYGEEMILSNSPECLFQYEKGKLLSMPIKGTVKKGSDWREDWKKLIADEKQAGELLMIVDLIRNDMNRLEKPVTQIKKLKAPLLVPGLLHQYALLSVNIENSLSVLRVLESMFPGGSITGAPKKRVMSIIQNIERFQRGIYCGSTLLCIGRRKAASINIRTATLSPADRLWRYGAGGGITLLSRPVEEFQEMESKLASFLTLIKAPGY
jgi:para-aminobenzoate synthetase component 1